MKAQPIALLLATLAGVSGSTLAQSTAPTATAPARELTRPDVVLHYTNRGEGEPVLLLMGGPGVASAGLEPVAEMIAKTAREIVPDQRGSGRSIPTDPAAITLDATLADFEALRVELGLERWTVWGCSWGGMLALDYAAKFPGSVKALILVGSGGTSWASFRSVFADNTEARMTAAPSSVLGLPRQSHCCNARRLCRSPIPETNLRAR